MRLIRCQIENFGKLSNFSYDFSKNENYICEENGWGKSTLVSFIRVMLFGFENEKSRDGFTKERAKYKPWQGGIYGGKLYVEAEGREYIITKQFGNKEKEDFVEIRDAITNLKIEDGVLSFGEKILGIDSSSFIRTVMITQNDCGTFTTDKINAKIGNLAENTDDINNYENVMREFSDILNKMSPTKKTGKLYAKKNQIAEKEVELSGMKLLDANLEETVNKFEIEKEKIANLEKSRNMLREKQKSSVLLREKLAKQDRYKSICEDYEDRKKQADTCKKAFINGIIPNEADIDRNIGISIELANLKNILNVYRLTEGENSKRDILLDKFRDKVPTEQDINELKNDIENLGRINIELASNGYLKDEHERIKEIEKKFNSDVPNENKVDEIISLWTERNNKKSEVSGKTYTLKSMEENEKWRKDEGNKQQVKNYKKMLIVGIVMFVIGVAGSSVNSYIAGTLFVLGVLCFAAGIVRMGLNSKGVNPDMKDFSNDNISLMRAEIEEDTKDIEEIDKLIKDFLSGCGYGFIENLAMQKLYEIKHIISEYKELQRKISNYDNNSDVELTKERIRLLRKIEPEIERYFGKDIEGHSYLELVHELKIDLSKYVELNEKRRNYDKTFRDVERLQREIIDYLNKIGVEYTNNIQETLLDIKNKVIYYENALEELNKITYIKGEFEKSNDINELINVNDEEVEEIGFINKCIDDVAGRIEQHQKNMRDYERQIDELYAKKDELQELAMELIELKEEYSAELKKYELIGKARTFMDEAKASFTSKYMEPLMNGFIKYHNVLCENSSEVYEFDANANILKEEYGVLHESKYLSDGYRDLTGICMRMAFIEAMYEGEKPFVIFDDPFVNLDDEKNAGAMKFLQQISREYQVIYLTCSNGRMV